MSKHDYYNKMIHSVRWQRLRKRVITKHPNCQCCEAQGLITAACEVHHVVPVETGINESQMRRLMFDEHNLMALCHRCHVQKHAEMGRSGKAQRRERVKAQLVNFSKKFFSETGGVFFKRGGGVS